MADCFHFDLCNKANQSYYTAGGSFEDPAYVFGYYGAYPGFYSSNKLGFRCVKNLKDAADDPGAMSIDVTAEEPRYTPAADASVKQWMNLYRYDRTPLAAEIIGVKETESWRREEIAYNGAVGERALAYLYLPKNFQPPLQVIHIVPAADVTSHSRTLTESIESN